MVIIRTFSLRWTSRTLRPCATKTYWVDRLYSSPHFAYALGRRLNLRPPQLINDHLLRFHTEPEVSKEQRHRIADKRTLAALFSFIRVDCLYTEGHLKIRRITNAPDSETGKLWPPSVEKRLGRLLGGLGLAVAEALDI